LVFPDYDRSILSIISSVMRYYGADCAYPTLPEIDEMLKTQPKHVMLLVLDGLGDVELAKALPENAYLRRNISARVTSVFPSTTTAATTAYATGLSPLEHGWLAWMLYMKEYATDVVTFMQNTHHTRKPVDGPYPAAHLMPYETAFEKIRTVNENVRTHSIYPFPSYSERGAHAVWHASDFSQFCTFLKRIASVDEPSFTHAYWTQPDAAMHDFGVGSPEALAHYKEINRLLEMTREKLPDTLLIISSDHGLVNAAEQIDLAQDADLMDTLVMPFMMESRAAAFYVKPHRKADFERIFREKYGDDFLLMSREEVYSSGIFGRGTPHRKFDDFIGDYIACATGTKVFNYSLPGQKMRKMAGYHAGLTEAEMRVAVILDRTE